MLDDISVGAAATVPVVNEDGVEKVKVPEIPCTRLHGVLSAAVATAADEWQDADDGVAGEADEGRTCVELTLTTGCTCLPSSPAVETDATSTSAFGILCINSQLLPTAVDASGMFR